MDSDGNFVITWADSRNGNDKIYGKDDIYTQRYNPNGNPQYRNYRVNNEPRISRQSKPAVATSSGNIYFTWEDDRGPGQGWDIFAKVVDWSWTKVEDKHIADTAIPRRFVLFQNFPNPFNSETTIRYQLPKECEVSIKIYNMKGQYVQTVVNQRQTQGYHAVKCNCKDHAGKSVSSGVYFYKLQTKDFVQTKKMVLLR